VVAVQFYETMRRAILIEAPFASAAQTAEALGVSRSRSERLVKLLMLKKSAKKRVSTRVMHRSAKGAGKTRRTKVEVKIHR
jgi:hypothetical protein